MVKRSTAGNAFSLLAAKILHMNEILLQAGETVAASASQTSARWRVLAAANMKQMTVAEIARALDLTRQSVQRLADALTEEGLTFYKKNPADKRAMHLVLSEKGKKTLVLLQAEQGKWANRAGEKINERLLKDLDKNLRELILSFQEGDQ